jgi:predicted SprT family Zn-dependent metalloprotease
VCEIYLNAELNASSKVSIKEWFKRLFSRRSKSDADNSKVNSGVLSPEQAADLRMRNEACRVRVAYEEKWRSVKTSDEKMALLNSFLAEIQKTKGTRAKSKINFASMNVNTLGSYSHRLRLVTINKNLLDKPEGINLLGTVIHEVRHAYQYEAAFNNRHPDVSSETRQLWRSNLPPPSSNYVSPVKNGVSNYDAYRNQPVEKDAFWFAGQRVC